MSKENKDLSIVSWPAVDASQLVQTVDTFYARLHEPERAIVRDAVRSVSDYLIDRHIVPYTIAGVGSILRKFDPADASDIDLAVVGYNPGREHGFGDITHFNFVRDYCVTLFRGTPGPHLLGRGSDTYRGSGPFPYADESFPYQRDGIDVTVEANIAEWETYGTKGFQIAFSKGCRPIDFQFVFNKSINEWKADQEKGYGRGEFHERDKYTGTRPPYLYAVLASRGTLAQPKQLKT